MTRLEELTKQHAAAAALQQAMPVPGYLTQQAPAPEQYREPTVRETLIRVAKEHRTRLDIAEQLLEQLPDDVLKLPLSMMHNVL